MIFQAAAQASQRVESSAYAEHHSRVKSQLQHRQEICNNES